MLGAREDRADDRSSRRRFGHPRLRRMDVEEDGAGQAHRPQHIRQRIHQHLRRRSARDPDDRQESADGRSFSAAATARYTRRRSKPERSYKET